MILISGEIEQSVFETLLANEKENFKTLYEKVRDSCVGFACTLCFTGIIDL